MYHTKTLQKKIVNRALTFENEPQVDALAAQIKELQDQANQLGEEGEVDESMKKMAEVEAIKVNKDILKSSLKKGGGGEFFFEKNGLFVGNILRKKKIRLEGCRTGVTYIHTYMEFGYIHIFTYERERHTQKGGGSDFSV